MAGQRGSDEDQVRAWTETSLREKQWTGEWMDGVHK